MQNFTGMLGVRSKDIAFKLFSNFMLIDQKIMPKSRTIKKSVPKYIINIYPPYKLL